jgi:hypothetical protein
LAYVTAPSPEELQGRLAVVLALPRAPVHVAPAPGRPMKALPTVDLSRIRDHAGAKDRGFEELAYLLAWDLEGLDRGTEIERRATPDGGIEFSCIPVGKGYGGRWAWQAKYLFKFDASTFAQMTKSVVSALETTPDLEHYIFVLPKDRSTAALSKWKTAVADWTKKAKAKGRKVEFEFRGESQLLAALTSDEHAGAIRYFFDEKFLTKKFMANQIGREVVNLGGRYSPEVNVETEARSIIDAACRGPRFAASFKELLSAPANNRPYMDRQGPSEPVILDGDKTIGTLLDDWTGAVVTSLEHLVDPGDAVFRTIESHAKALRTGIEAVQTTVNARIAKLTAQSRKPTTRQRPATPPSRAERKSAAQKAEDERDRHRESLHSFDSSLWRLRGRVDEVIHHLGSADIAAASSGSVLLVGEAGCGKSHLVADVATERIADDLPSFLLLSQQLDTGLIDPQIVQMLGLGTMTLGDTLQALDVAARIRRKGRALLVIDAINEGAGADLWENQLPGFVAEVARYPWVALVITLRDVYETSVMPGGTPIPMTKSVHRGLAGHEEEALNLYAAVYGLRLPDVPALLPEITNPLFLRSLCQSVQGRGLKEIPREAGSLVWVFDGLIEGVDKTLQRRARLNYANWEHKVQAAVAALAGAMIDAGSEAMPIAQASGVCRAVHPSTENSKSLLNGLIVEGLLLRETVDRDGIATDTIRFTYQRLSDHLRAEVLLERNPTTTKLAAAVRTISKAPRPWAMSGVVGALVLLVPEKRGKELATVLRFGEHVVGERWAHGDPGAWLRGVAQEAFFETLMWRNPATFTPATHDLLRRYLDAGGVENHEWLRIISGLACVPNHPLNAEWLHPILWRMSPSERDDAWSRQLVWVYSDDINPVSRTIDWAWANPNAPEDVARLASVYLAWLFTSTNRRLRDTATKALVSVTTHRPAVLAELVRRFARVNDPYVIDRVVAAAYGHVLRRRHHIKVPADLEALKDLAQAVFDAVYGTGEPVAHLMLRHRAQMCAQIVDDLCRAAGGELERDLDIARPPYGTSWPLTAPTAAQLAKGFGRDYTGYLGSATEIDWEFEQNFERRVLEDLVLPDQEKLRAARRRNLTRQRTAALKRLVGATATSRKARVQRRAESLMAEPRDSAIAFMHGWTAFEASVPKASRGAVQKLRGIAEQLGHLDDKVLHPDADLCTRWIAARMLDLGWTKDRFGETDAHLREYRGQTATERVAKKYERIAFQELCGHLVDHCTIDYRWREDREPYQGPWQISETIDIDPSLLVRGDEPEGDTPASRLRTIRLRDESQPTWWRTATDHKLDPERTNDEWLGVTTDIPRPEDVIGAIDPDGGEWLALEWHQEWTIKDPTDLGTSYRRDKRQLWIRTQANIIRADDQVHARWAGNTNWMGLSNVSTPADMWIGGLGEYPDVGAWPSELDLSDREHRPYDPEDDPGLDELPAGWELAKIDDTTTAPYALATVGCHQESGNDYSTTDTPGVLMPSRVLLGLLDAHWSGGLDDDGALGLGAIEREYSWVSGGEVVAFCSGRRGYGGARVLWARAESLRQALDGAGVAMWTWVLGEKIYWSGDEPSSDRADCFAGVRLSPGPTTVWGFTVERERGRHRGNGGTRSRVLAERADGIAKVPMARRPRPRKMSKPSEADLARSQELLDQLARFDFKDLGET